MISSRLQRSIDESFRSSQLSDKLLEYNDGSMQTVTQIRNNNANVTNFDKKIQYTL